MERTLPQENGKPTITIKAIRFYARRVTECIKIFYICHLHKATARPTTARKIPEKRIFYCGGSKICLKLQPKITAMKGKYRKEIIEESLKIYPCSFCGAEPVCERQNWCNMYKSCHNIYNRIGKTKGIQLLDYLQLCETQQQAMEAVLQYNQ